ncbi:MAG: YceI family protein [Alphaproteobacteria bacterium]|nr:MAG: YceI family protein [Alphaproteobacteria bacterium]
MRKLILTAALTLAALPAFAATSWNLEPTSKLTWAVPFNKQPVTGQFDTWSADIAFDPASLETSSLTIKVDLTSVNSKDANRDTTLKGPEFFNTATTPTATFTSTKITKTSQGYVAGGNLTLAGVTKPLAVPFTLAINGPKAVAQGKIRLSRNAFGVGKGQWKSASEIADIVEVSFTVNAVAKP